MSADEHKASLKRVLLKIKGVARGMRKGNLEERLNPKPKPAMVEEEKVELPLDVATAVEAKKAPEDLGVPSDEEEKKESKADRAKEIASIRSLLARV